MVFDYYYLVVDVVDVVVAVDVEDYLFYYYLKYFDFVVWFDEFE